MDHRRYLQLMFAAFCLVARGLTQIDVTFIMEPPNITIAEEGEEVFCPCEYNGTTAVAAWNINRTSYYATSLPYGFFVNASGLVFVAQPYLTHTTFQCFLVLYNSSSGEYFNYFSTIGDFISGEYAPQTELQFCKPRISGVYAARIHEEGAEVDITWITDTLSPECQNISYLVELNTCIDYSQLCSIMTDHGATQIQIAASNCSGVNIDQPLIFSVKADHTICKNSSDTSSDTCEDPEWNCYSTYGYTTSLMDTDDRDVEEGDNYLIQMPTNCNEICVVKLPEINICADRTTTSDNLMNIPGGYHFCGTDVCIEDVKQSLNNAVHTIWCEQFEDCPDECQQFQLKRVLMRNFKLTVHSQGDRLRSSCLIGMVALGVLLLNIGM